MPGGYRFFVRLLLAVVVAYVVSWHVAFVLGVAVPTLRVGYSVRLLGQAYVEYFHYLWTPAHGEVPAEVQRLGLLVFGVLLLALAGVWALNRLLHRARATKAQV